MGEDGSEAAAAVPPPRWSLAAWLPLAAAEPNERRACDHERGATGPVRSGSRPRRPRRCRLRQECGAAIVTAATGPARIVVRRAVGRHLAREYRVSKRAIIAANNLKPPYKIEIGQRLVIPGAAAAADRDGGGRAAPPHRRWPAASALPRPAAPPRARGQCIPPDGPVAGPTQPAPPPPNSRAAPPAAHAEPNGAPAARAEAAPPSAAGGAPPRRRRCPAAGISRGRCRAGCWPATASLPAAPTMTASTSPRRAARRCEAVDGGIVAYAGNELRGYGNLVLVKHANG